MGYTALSVERKVKALLEINKLYNEGNLNFNTFAPFYDTPNLVLGLEQDYVYLKNRKIVDLNDPEVINMMENLPEICKMIREYTTGINLENLKYRKSVEDILEKNCYLENYMYAFFVVKAYITDAKSYKTVEFLRKYNLDDETFEYCVSLIQFINPVLYKEYLNRYHANTNERKEAIFHEFYNLAKRIEECKKNGEELSIFEFFRMTPFKESGPIYIDKLRSFLGRGYTLNTIAGYVYEHKIPRFNYMRKDQEISITRIIDGHRLTPHDNENIIKIMDVYGIPYIKKLYNLVTDEYIAGKYDMDEISKKHEMLENKETVEIPYQYIRVANTSNKNRLY